MKRLSMAGLALLVLVTNARAGDDLAEKFATPPDAAKPWVFMWWFGKITPADVTQHMQELKSKGVGGVLLFDLGGMPGAPYMSARWRELFRHAVREADRLGLKMAVNICAGWPSGGPWITPENSSWMVVSSQTVVKGPRKFSAKLVQAQGRGTLYADVAVQAFPIPDGNARPQPVVTASSNPQDVPKLLDGNYNTVWNSGGQGKQWILVDFAAPHVVDWAWIDVPRSVTLEASDDGLAFRPVAQLHGPMWNLIYEAIPSTTARWFRIVVPNNVAVRDIALGTRAEVERAALLAAKRALTHPLGVTTTRQADQVRFVRQDLPGLPTDHPLKSQGMVDLTGRVSADGTLNWEAPPGTWKIVRVGRTTTGIAAGGGLLPDYLSPAASAENFEKGIKPVIDDAGPLVGKTFQYLHEDNVEIDGVYSWTPKLLDEFRKRRGYDPTPYLAALAGEIVDNVEITDRFLADVRRTIADCVADWHYGRWAELAHANGMQVRAEAGGQHHPRLLCCDGLMNQGRMDVPVAEFWENEFWKENPSAPANHHAVTTPGWDEAAQDVNAKQTASAAHLYGKRIVASESFTSLGRRAHWGVAPGDLLLYANIAFCEGINAMTIHGSATSGPDDGMPGKVYAAGTHFNHNVTWWNHSGAFLRYLARCQHMLQEGLFVADVLYYSGDEAPNFVPPKNIDPSRGFGYDYDVCNTEILLTRLSVNDGRIVLPDGMSYRVLVLPERPVLPLSVAGKLQELVAAGATVIGPKPQRTPGLADYPRSEQRLREIADTLWGRETPSNRSPLPPAGRGQAASDAAKSSSGSWTGPQGGFPPLQRGCGKGSVACGPSIREVLEKAAVPPDFAFQSKMENALLDFIHRRDDHVEIYFVANRGAAALNADCTFRVSGKQPELWDPVTGEHRDLPQFLPKDGRTSLALKFEPYGSMFVVFRKEIPKSEDRFQNPGVGNGNRAKVNFPELKPVREIAGPWTVQFDPQWFYPTAGLSGDQAKGLMVFDKLDDWTRRAEPAVRDFSGTATYRTRFPWTGGETTRKKIFLGLGTVKVTAGVRLNGKQLGVVWCHPWRIEVAAALKPGENTLEIDVVNLWPNRLLADSKLTPQQRRTRTSGPLRATIAPLPSGLLGPVRLMAED